jgi:hypothetical protein
MDDAFEQARTEAAVHLDAKANDPLGQTRAVLGPVSVTSVLSAISVFNLCVLHIAPRWDGGGRRTGGFNTEITERTEATEIAIPSDLAAEDCFGPAGVTRNSPPRGCIEGGLAR